MGDTLLVYRRERAREFNQNLEATDGIVPVPAIVDGVLQGLFAPWHHKVWPLGIEIHLDDLKQGRYATVAKALHRSHLAGKAVAPFRVLQPLKCEGARTTAFRHHLENPCLPGFGRAAFAASTPTSG